MCPLNNGTGFNKLHLFRCIKHVFILFQNVPLHVYYVFQPVRRPSTCMSIQKLYNRKYNKIESKGPMFTVTVFLYC